MDEDEEFEAPTRVDPNRYLFDDETVEDPSPPEEETTHHDLDARTTLPSVIVDQQGSEAAARTIVQALPGPQPATKTHRRPLPPTDSDTFDAPTRAVPMGERSAPLDPPPPARSTPPLATANVRARGGDPQIPRSVVVGGALMGLLLCAGGFVAWLVLEGSDGPTGVWIVETPTSVAPPQGEGGPEPLAVAPPLPEAARLAIAGRFDEAARAYAALAREHPDRPELSTMARVLHAKATRR